MTLLNVQKIKLQLFHRLQRRHRDAWKSYWSAFQLYVAARLSLEEFHALAEELLGPEKRLHNRLVVSLLSTVSQELKHGELQRSPQLPLALEIQGRNGDEERKEAAIDEDASMSSTEDPLLQFARKEGTRYESEQLQQDSLGRKRPHSGIVPVEKTDEYHDSVLSVFFPLNSVTWDVLHSLAASKLMHLGS